MPFDTATHISVSVSSMQVVDEVTSVIFRGDGATVAETGKGRSKKSEGALTGVGPVCKGEASFPGDLSEEIALDSLLSAIEHHSEGLPLVPEQAGEKDLTVAPSRFSLV